MRLNALFAFITIKVLIARQVMALPDVVHQLLNQHRREPFTVVLDGAADVADIELLLRGDQRLKEQIAVIVAAATVATLGLLAH